MKLFFVIWSMQLWVLIYEIFNYDYLVILVCNVFLYLIIIEFILRINSLLDMCIIIWPIIYAFNQFTFRHFNFNCKRLHMKKNPLFHKYLYDWWVIQINHNFHWYNLIYYLMPLLVYLLNNSSSFWHCCWWLWIDLILSLFCLCCGNAWVFSWFVKQ